jgi:cell wall-active antibiotic response 4TMS protein YvqF/B-box zinc finger protein
MNCANHADASAVAYCRTCGKALCANCTRPVRGVIYCEDCLGARMEGTPAAAAGFVSSTIPPAAAQGRVPPPPPPPGSGSGPNPTVAGILAGFFPFGVGPVYTGQYAKGLAHLAIFVLLIAGANASDSGHSEALGIICGFGIAFFYVYQIIDSVRSAKAIQMAQPLPDPFGLAATFGGGAKIEVSKIPMGAIVLILLGVLFLLHTMGVGLGLDRFWPLILIGLGVWLFARNWGLTGSCCTGCQCARCRTRRIMGPAMLVTVGALFLLANLDVANFGRTWPVILLVCGGVKLLQGSASTEGHILPPGPGTTPPGGPIPPVPPEPPTPPVPPTSEVNRG